MIKNLILFLLLILGISCSNPSKKELTTKESVDKKINQLYKSQTQIPPAKLIADAKEIKKQYESIHDDKGIMKCNNMILVTLFDLGNYNEVLKVGKDNEAVIRRIKDEHGACVNYKLIGSAYMEMGLLDEGLKYLNKSMESNKKMQIPDERYFELSKVYDGFGRYAALKTDSPDSVQKYNILAINALEKISDNNPAMKTAKPGGIATIYLAMGMISNRQKKYEEAENYYQKAFVLCKKYNITKNPTLYLYDEMAWVLLDQKKYDSCIAYSQKGIDLERINSAPHIRVDYYEALYKSYTAKSDEKNAAKYGNLYIKLNDSIRDVEKLSINTPVKNIITEKEKDHKNDLNQTLLLVGCVILVAATFLFFLWKRKQRTFHSRYEDIISKLKKEDDSSDHVFVNTEIPEVTHTPTIPAADRSNLNIHDNTINTILQKLEKFEKSEKYLKKDKSLTSVASSLETNPRYLSEIIKQYKGKNFNNYLNGLRIQYIIQLLYKEPIYREYKITYLAEHCGFASREVFAIAFKKETGMTPSYFIEQLRESE